MQELEHLKFKQIFIQCIKDGNDLSIDSVDWDDIKYCIRKEDLQKWDDFLSMQRKFHREDYRDWLNSLDNIEDVKKCSFSNFLPDDKITVVITNEKQFFGEVEELFDEQLNKIKILGKNNELDAYFILDNQQILFEIYSMNIKPGSIYENSPIKRENDIAVKIYSETQKKLNAIIKKFNDAQGEHGLHVKAAFHKEGGNSDEYFIEGAAFEKIICIDGLIPTLSYVHRRPTEEEIRQFFSNSPNRIEFVKAKID